MRQAVDLTAVPFCMDGYISFSVADSKLAAALGDDFDGSHEMFEEPEMMRDQAKFQRIAADYGWPQTRPVPPDVWEDFIHRQIREFSMRLDDPTVDSHRSPITAVKWEIERAWCDCRTDPLCEESWRVEAPGCSAVFDLPQIKDQDFFIWRLIDRYSWGLPLKVSQAEWLGRIAQKRREYAERRRSDLRRAIDNAEFRRVHRFTVRWAAGEAESVVFDRPRAGEFACLASDPDVYVGEVLEVNETAGTAAVGWVRPPPGFRQECPLTALRQWPDLDWRFLHDPAEDD